MSNRRELRNARRAVLDAEQRLEGIRYALPRRIGQTVTWPNGVVWRRVGDDQWMPLHDDRHDYGTYSSAHVAWGLGYGPWPGGQ